MTYRLTSDETVIEGVRRVAQEQIDMALDEIDDGDLDLHETVHQVRKRLKKLRALVRLVRPAFEDTYQRENVAFRDAGRVLSEARDAQAQLETLDLLVDTYEMQLADGAFTAVRKELKARRDRLVDAQSVPDRVHDVKGRLVAARRRVVDWTLDDEGYDAIGPGIRKSYERARRRLEEAYDEASVHVFHQWRKRVKYHRYHVRLLEDLWPRAMEARRATSHLLSDLLGDAHDLAVFKNTVTESPDTFGRIRDIDALVGFMDRCRGVLRRKAHPVGVWLFTEPGDALVDRFGGYWDAWQLAIDDPVMPGDQPA